MFCHACQPLEIRPPDASRAAFEVMMMERFPDEASLRPASRSQALAPPTAQNPSDQQVLAPVAMPAALDR